VACKKGETYLDYCCSCFELGLDRLRNARDGSLEGNRNVAGTEMQLLEK
jgi:hypothetical protein